jgi:hypothetical protein
METVDQVAKRLGVSRRALLQRMWKRASAGKTTTDEVKVLLHTLMLEEQAAAGDRPSDGVTGRFRDLFGFDPPGPAPPFGQGARCV